LDRDGREDGRWWRVVAAGSSPWWRCGSSGSPATGRGRGGAARLGEAPADARSS
jgi:hypothetical protein